MEKFQNKYRIPSSRAQWWNYSNNGIYFITICSKHGEYLFGEVHDGEMYLSEIGMIVNQEWNISFDLRKELLCDAFCIMPNHLHALLRIENNHVEIDESKKTGIARRQPKSISSFVGAMKAAVTKKINIIKNSEEGTIWHDRFHDHIVCNDREYQTITNYIQNNPQRWQDDKFHRLNLGNKPIDF